MRELLESLIAVALIADIGALGIVLTARLQGRYRANIAKVENARSLQQG